MLKTKERTFSCAHKCTCFGTDELSFAFKYTKGVVSEDKYKGFHHSYRKVDEFTTAQGKDVGRFSTLMGINIGSISTLQDECERLLHTPG